MGRDRGRVEWRSKMTLRVTWGLFYRKCAERIKTTISQLHVEACDDSINSLVHAHYVTDQAFSKTTKWHQMVAQVEGPCEIQTEHRYLNNSLGYNMMKHFHGRICISVHSQLYSLTLERLNFCPCTAKPQQGFSNENHSSQSSLP